MLRDMDATILKDGQASSRNVALLFVLQRLEEAGWSRATDWMDWDEIDIVAGVSSDFCQLVHGMLHTIENKLGSDLGLEFSLLLTDAALSSNTVRVTPDCFSDWFHRLINITNGWVISRRRSISSASSSSAPQPAEQSSKKQPVRSRKQSSKVSGIE